MNFIKLNSLRTLFKFSKSSFLIPMLNAKWGYIFLIILHFFNFFSSCCFVRHVIISNSANFSAISNSPTPSIFAAIIGIPDHSFLLYLNL